MAFNFNLGRDASVVMLDSNGNRIDIQYIMDFDQKQDSSAIVVDGMDGIRHQWDAPKGWSGSFTTTRQNAALDQFFSDLESDWFDNGVADLATIYVYLNEKDGSTTTFQYTDCSLKFSDGGKLANNDKPVEMKVEFVSSRRMLV